MMTTNRLTVKGRARLQERPLHDSDVSRLESVSTTSTLARQALQTSFKTYVSYHPSSHLVV